MKRTALLIMSAILTLAGTAMADVKIKSKQTTGGQSTESTTFIKGKRTRTEMMNGLMVSITQCDIGRDLQINPQTKTYMVDLYEDGTVSEPRAVDGKSVPVAKGGSMYVTTTIKDTGERKQMFGYTARHIIQTVETTTSPDACTPHQSKMEMDSWVIDAEFGASCQQARQYVPRPKGPNGGCHDKIVPKTIGTAKSGYAVWQKMTGFDVNGKETFSMIQEVVELSKATLDQALFEAPADYREVKDEGQMYATGGPSSGSSSGSLPSYGSSPNDASSSGLSSSIKTAAAPQPETAAPTTLSPKKPGTIRVGVAVKTTSVGEGITANDLTAAVQNTLGQYLKGTKVEVVTLESKLAAAQAGEANEKECDYVIQVTAAHKKGGGGFGGFGKVFSSVVSQTGMVPVTGAGQVARTAVYTASSLSTNVRSKDEITLDIKVQSAADGKAALAKQFKAKAKADGDDIISAIIEQAAQAILDAVGK